MAFNDTFRLSSHAVITNPDGHILLLKANYGSFSWGLPGGALEPGETIHEALIRECTEELNCDVVIDYLSGVYFHSAYNFKPLSFAAPSHRPLKFSSVMSILSFGLHPFLNSARCNKSVRMIA